MELSTCIGVGGWILCIYINVVIIGASAWPLRNGAPYSSSAVDAMMLGNILQKIKMKLLSMGVYSSNVSASGLGSLRKNTPLDLLLALVTDKYEASI